jgi:hypothetical protein
MWQSIVNWVTAQGGWAHAIVVAIVAVIGAYAAVPAFAELVNNLYAMTPSWFHEVALAAIGIFLTYFDPSTSKK